MTEKTETQDEKLTFRAYQDGLELADSYTFNAHKWLATNFDCSIFWVADRRPLIESLSMPSPILEHQTSESGQVIDYRDWHVPLGRRFRALKLWWVLRCFGVEGLQKMIREHVGWARMLADRIDADHIGHEGSQGPGEFTRARGDVEGDRSA